MRLYVHAITLGTGKPGDPFRPSLYPPTIENTAALLAAGVFCADLDGNRTELADRGDQGRVEGIVKNLGPICISTLDVADDVWPTVQAAADRFLYGETLPDLKAAAAAKFDDEMSTTLAIDPTLGAAILAAPTSAPETVRAYLAGLAFDDPIVESFRSWVVGRLAGSTALELPTAMLGSTGVDLPGIASFWEMFQTAAPEDPIRVVARLWNVARTAIVTNGT